MCKITRVHEYKSKEYTYVFIVYSIALLKHFAERESVSISSSRVIRFVAISAQRCIKKKKVRFSNIRATVGHSVQSYAVALSAKKLLSLKRTDVFRERSERDKRDGASRCEL